MSSLIKNILIFIFIDIPFIIILFILSVIAVPLFLIARPAEQNENYKHWSVRLYIWFEKKVIKKFINFYLKVTTKR